MRADDGTTRIVVTNYEMLPHFDVAAFAAVVLDESSIIKHHDSKTRGAVIEAFARTPFRLACTATPAPNDHTELGNHAEFLRVLAHGDALNVLLPRRRRDADVALAATRGWSSGDGSRRGR